MSLTGPWRKCIIKRERWGGYRSLTSNEISGSSIMTYFLPRHPVIYFWLHRRCFNLYTHSHIHTHTQDPLVRGYLMNKGIIKKLKRMLRNINFIFWFVYNTRFNWILKCYILLIFCCVKLNTLCFLIKQ